ncbi:MAG: hypothetical protein DRJ66_05860 [Thermoprotei archaeon]|nr:MAG: hypothetical protein DRJ66_05860 [Thermoprotei archaeon]RLF17962.1 MAG: hypothetical protein DRZ82_09135 [Thermoprotei archaeon]
MEIVPVMEPYNLPKPELRGDVGSPCIVYNPFEPCYYLLFLGEKDPAKPLREVWVAPMEKDLTVDLRNAKQLVKRATVKELSLKGTPILVPMKRDLYLSAVRAVFNAAKREYIMTLSIGKHAYIFYFDEEWNLSSYHEVYSESGDHGFPIAPIGAYGREHQALTTIPKGNLVKLGYFDNVDSPTHVSLILDKGYAFQHGFANDVCDLTLLPRIALFYESDEFGQWKVKIGLGPSTADFAHHREPGVEFNVGFLVAYLQSILPFHSQYIQIGHPHYTTYPDGKPKLLVACFRDTWSTRPETGREGYRHEIHAVYLDDIRIFDPRTYGVMRDTILSSERGNVSKWYDVSEATRITLMISGYGNIIKLNIDEASSIAEALDGIYITKSYEVTVPAKITINDPAPIMRIRSEKKNVKVTMVVKY